MLVEDGVSGSVREPVPLYPRVDWTVVSALAAVFGTCVVLWTTLILLLVSLL